MAARTTQLALLVDQLMPALQTKPPMLAGNVFRRWHGAWVDSIAIRVGFSALIASFQIFSPVRGSSFRSASGGRADRCRASRNGANPRPDFPVPGRPSGSLAFTAWRQTVLAIVCSPSRARFTVRPAAFNSSTRSITKRRASPTFTNGGSASSKKVRSPNSLNPTPSRVSAASCSRKNCASRGGSSIVSGSNSFCDGATPPDSIRFSICSNKIRSCAACWSSSTSPRSDSSTTYSLPTTPTSRSGTFSSGVGDCGLRPLHFASARQGLRIAD